VLPHADPLFVSAIEQAGGTVEPLGPRTRAILWLASRGGEDFSHLLAENPQVQWMQLPWAGVDAFADALNALDRDDLVWTSAKGAYSEPVAEHALTLALALLRVLPERIRATSWGDKRAGTLYRANVVIVGAGGIAQELLRLLAPFGAHVTVVRRSDAPLEGAERTVSSSELAEVLPGADIVFIAAALTSGTSKLFSAAEFERMKPTAYIVNVARGPLIDTDALVAAVNDGTIAGAALDVTDPEPLPDGHALWSTLNTIITPHTADTPEMTRRLLAERTGRNVAAVLAGRELEGVVDPEAGY
jgi:phosphoglycerate dehydrogenase-like enzyme